MSHTRLVHFLETILVDMYNEFDLLFVYMWGPTVWVWPKLKKKKGK
jgi:hypothetical protein